MDYNARLQGTIIGVATHGLILRVDMYKKRENMNPYFNEKELAPEYSSPDYKREKIMFHVEPKPPGSHLS